MSKHIGMPGERRTFNVTVVRAIVRETEFGPMCDHTFQTPEGDILYWEASTKATFLQEGCSYGIKATIKGHDKNEDGEHRTILTRVVEYYEPPRVPRVAVGLRRSAIRR